MVDELEERTTEDLQSQLDLLYIDIERLEITNKKLQRWVKKIPDINKSRYYGELVRRIVDLELELKKRSDI